MGATGKTMVRLSPMEITMEIVRKIGVARDLLPVAVVVCIDLGLAVTVVPDLLHHMVDDDPLAEVVVEALEHPCGRADLAVARLMV
jgi:hypothetical protein